MLRWIIFVASAPAAVARGPVVEGWGPIDILRTCISDIGPYPVAAWDKKGLTVEDTTLMFCPDKVPEIWPNTLAPVRSIRVFRAWHEDWWKNSKVVDREFAWQSLKDFAISNGAKVMLGTQVTCESEDDKDFAYVIDLAKMLGPENVLGLGVGNEIDLLYTKMKDDRTVSDKCIKSIWDEGQYWAKFQDRVRNFSSIGPGFEKIPVTAVFSAAALGGWPFQEERGKAMVNSFLKNASNFYGKRFVFTFNHYTYFDDNLRLDPGSSRCTKALSVADCWHAHCMTPQSMASARRRMRVLTGKDDFLYWVGETGWSSPQPQTLGTHMAACREWSSLKTFKRFYSGFLNWDLRISNDERPPDHIFYFSVRTSLNFGFSEYFGLINQCSNRTCKVKSEHFAVEKQLSQFQKQQAVIGRLREIGFVGVLSVCLISLLGSAVYVTLIPTRCKTRRLRQRFEAEPLESPSSSSSESE